MFHYDFSDLNNKLTGILQKNISAEAFAWLKEKAASGNTVQFNTAFVSIPRKTGKAVLDLSEKDINGINAARPGFFISGWTADRLARVWLLMQKDISNKEKYHDEIEALFPSAEVNELVALYSALPVLAYPESWTARCAEGIRNNIGDVLSAIMCHNPYPSENLSDAAWNQLVLKAFFTDKPVEDIVGLDKRANRPLALTLSDYAHERWAAHRTVNPQIWRCVAPFIDENILPDIIKISGSDDPHEREAAALAVFHTPYEPAKTMLSDTLSQKIASGELSWNSLAQKTKEHVLQ